MISNKYKIKARVWLSAGVTAPTGSVQSRRYFVSIPKKESKEIKERFYFMKRGWSSLRVVVNIGNTKWNTSIFPDKKSGTYLLPLKVEVRKKEDIKNNNIITFLMEIIV